MSNEENHISEQIPERLQGQFPYNVVFNDGNALEQRGVVYLDKEIKSPFDLDLTQFIPTPPICFEEFAGLCSQLVEDAQVREGVVAKERVVIAQEYNPELFADIGDEVITFKVIRREPAKMSRDGKSRPNRGFNFNYEHRSPKEPNKIISIESRPIDHILEISAWAKTSTLANKRALWLERLFVGHRWVFTIRGATPFYWIERGPDTLWTPGGARLHQRPIKFFVRLKEYIILAYPTIKEFQIDYNTET